MKLSQKITELRKSRGWSQEELAYRLGVTRQSVGKWESEAALPELDKVVQMAELFGVSTDYLLKGEDEADSAKQSAAKEEPSVTVETTEETTADESKSGNDDVKGKRSKTVFAGISSLIWLGALVAFLTWSFIGGRWDISWISWILGGVLQGIVAAIFGICGVDVKNGKSSGKTLFAQISSIFWLLVLAAYILWSVVWNGWTISWILWVAAAVAEGIAVAIFNICGVDVKNKQADKSDER